jgi:hypothetical protein
MRNGENDMKVLYPQGFFHAVLNPESLLCRLAFRAMPVSAAVVADAFAPAAIAALNMSAQGRGPAFLKCVERTDNIAVGLVFFDVLRSETVNDLSQPVSGIMH